MFEPANDIDMKDAFTLIKEKIDKTFDHKKTTWQEIYKNNDRLVAFIQSHCRRERDHLEIFKCGKINCKVCNTIRMPTQLWDELMKRSRFIPLPTPRDISEKDGKIEYENYQYLKYKTTSEIHRPSYKITEVANKEAKIYDNKISK